jgi:hypothetical protein
MTAKTAGIFGLLLAACWLCLAGCATTGESLAGQRLADREAIEQVLASANLGFELSDPDRFANAFAPDAVYELNGAGPVFGYSNTDPKTLSYDPATLRRFNRNTDSLIEIVDRTHARHWSTWMVVMHTNQNIHISAVGRYEDQLEKRDGKWLIVRRKRIE